MLVNKLKQRKWHSLKNYLVVQFIKLLFYLFILSAIVFTLYVYSDDYDIFPWATKDESLKFLHLVITVPIPLITAFCVDFLLKRKPGCRTKVIKFLPLICILFISLYTVVFHPNSTNVKFGFALAIILFFFVLYLMVYDLLRKCDTRAK